MLSLAIIKSLLSGVGIKNLNVKFDKVKEQITADFDFAGQHDCRQIDFAEIEQALSGKPEAPPGPPGLPSAEESNAAGIT